MHKNNFDFLRFLFASLVCYTHSFDLLLLNKDDLFMQISNNQINGSYIGLFGFFIISGYLVYESYKRCDSAFSFIWRRFLRIYPGLFTALVVIVVFSGFFLTSLDFKDFFNSNNSYFFVLKNSTLLHKLQWFLPGVFEGNPNIGTVNGSIWTIGYEIFFYICIACLFFWKRIDNIYAFLVILFLCYFGKMAANEYRWLAIPFTTIGVYFMFTFGQFFVAGMILNLLKDFFASNTKNILLAIVSLFFFVLAIYSNIVIYVSVLLLPIIIIAVSNIKCKLNNFGKFGDISFGIYIYSFFIQQVLIHFYPQIIPLVLFIYSWVLSIIVGLLSWNFVESKALKYKRSI